MQDRRHGPASHRRSPAHTLRGGARPPPAPAGRDRAAPARTLPESPGAGGRGRRGRIGGLDAARALAILGMIAVHVGPTHVEGVAGRLYAAPHGRASILFVLIAGVGVSLLASSRRRSTLESRLALTWRAALLLPLGLALQELDHGAHVILQDYALFFLLAVFVLRWSDRWLVTLAAASAVLGPVLFLLGRMTVPGGFARESTAITDSPGEILHGLVLSGPYPLITWAAPFLLGMWIGRRNLRSHRLRAALVVGGGAVAAASLAASRLLADRLGVAGDGVGLEHLVTATPHSQMPLWLIGGTGAAAMVLGGSLVAAELAPRLFRPLVVAGQLALTIYVAHLLALHRAPDRLTSSELGGAVLLLAAFTAAILAFSVAWRARFSRGPLEFGLQLPGRWGVRRPEAP